MVALPYLDTTLDRLRVAMRRLTEPPAWAHQGGASWGT